MNRRGVLRVVRCGPRVRGELDPPYRISTWLEARPCPRLSSDVRSSRRNDNPTGHGILFDIVVFVLCSTRDLRGRERERNETSKGSARGKRKVRPFARLLCGSYSYIRIMPSSSHVTRDSCSSAKKKSAAVTQTLKASFAKMTSLYGSSCSGPAWSACFLAARGWKKRALGKQQTRHSSRRRR